MSATAWDIAGSGRHLIGARHFVVEWLGEREGHTCDDSCAARDLLECFGSRSRAFPTEGLAAAFARKCESVWGARYREEEFEAAGGDSVGPLGSWEPVGDGEYVEVEGVSR